MSRKNYIPGSDKSIIPYEMIDFSSSVIKGIPASRIPDNALADAYDVVIYPTEVVGREGSTLYTSVTIPALDDRTGYTASMSGNVITASTSIFSQDDVSNYFVFPGSPDAHYEIIEYISGTQVRGHTTGSHSSVANCYLRGKTNLAQWHKIQKKWIFIWGEQVYTAEIGITELTRCRVISRDLPSNAISGYDDFDEYTGLIFNSNGIFKIDLSYTEPLVYKINIPIPNISITDIPETTESNYNYHYLYSTCRLKSTDNIVDRLSPSRIELETGTNIWDDTYRDYSDVYTVDPIGTEVYTFGVLTCGDLSNPYDNYSGWQAIGIGSFRIGVDVGVPPWPFPELREVVCDFSTVMNMVEVAAVIQNALRDFYPDATCDYDDGHFVLTSGRNNSNANITYAYTGVAAGTTDISGHMAGDYANGARLSEIDTAIRYTKSALIVGPLYVPTVNTIEYQWHMTHFPIYRTKDLAGRYKIDTNADQFNSPNDFVWVDDLRICGAFYGYVASGYFIAEQGEFEQADVGSTLEFDNGERREILSYVSSQIVTIDNITDYYPETTDMHAAAIGNGRVFRAYQSGNVVTKTRGSEFSASDVRKPIKWATGYYSYITEYISPTQVRVSDDQDKTTMGMTIDPVYRYFYDTTDDEDLDARLTRLKLKQRYWEAMPNCNVGKVTPGLIFCAQRGDNTLNYGQIPDAYEYLHGFHDKGYQITKKIMGDIQYMWLFQDVLIIWTSKKTWRWPTTGYQFLTNQYTKDAILQIAGIEIADEDRGCFDYGSIVSIGDGKVMLLTYENGRTSWRQYNGFQYSEDVLELSIGKDRIPEIQDLQQATKAFYDNRAGLLLFGRE